MTGIGDFVQIMGESFEKTEEEGITIIARAIIVIGRRLVDDDDRRVYGSEFFRATALYFPASSLYIIVFGTESFLTTSSTLTGPSIFLSLQNI